MFQKWSSGTGTSGGLSKPSTVSRGGCAWPAVKPIRALFPNPAGWLGRGLEIVHARPLTSNCDSEAFPSARRAQWSMVEQRAHREMAGGALMTASHQRLACGDYCCSTQGIPRVDKLWEPVLLFATVIKLLAVHSLYQKGPPVLSGNVFCLLLHGLLDCFCFFSASSSPFFPALPRLALVRAASC